MAIQLSLFPEEPKMDKYKVLSDRYFSFEIFENIFEVINERASTSDDHMFKAGVASSEAAVRRLREDFYNSIKKMYVQEDTSYGK
jgi:hypothetical protein